MIDGALEVSSYRMCYGKLSLNKQSRTLDLSVQGTCRDGEQRFTFQADLFLPLVDHLLGDQVAEGGGLLDRGILHQKGIHFLTQPGRNLSSYFTPNESKLFFLS